MQEHEPGSAPAEVWVIKKQNKTLQYMFYQNLSLLLFGLQFASCKTARVLKLQFNCAFIMLSRSAIFGDPNTARRKVQSRKRYLLPDFKILLHASLNLIIHSTGQIYWLFIFWDGIKNSILDEFSNYGALFCFVLFRDFRKPVVAGSGRTQGMFSCHKSQTQKYLVFVSLSHAIPIPALKTADMVYKGRWLIPDKLVHRLCRHHCSTGNILHVCYIPIKLNFWVLY